MDSNTRFFFCSTQDAVELNELSQRAQATQSLDEFIHNLSEKLDRDFKSLYSKYWDNIKPDEAFTLLKQVSVEVAGEGFLQTAIESRLETLVEEDSSTVIPCLVQLMHDRIHHELTAHEVWGHLEKLQFHRRRWGNDPHILDKVKIINEQYISRLENAAIGGKIIPRDEVNDIVTKITSPSGNPGVVVVGRAGTGKSGVLLQVAKEISIKDWPLLTFRIDLLEPTPQATILGKSQLELPGSPVSVLAEIAQKRDCVLIIDQLDAVSLVSGRNPNFFNCIEEIIRQAQTYPNMKLILGCREFDLNNDHRFKNLVGENNKFETVPIQNLSLNLVKNIITEHGLNAERLTPKQLELLSIPLHLKLVTEVAGGNQTGVLDFTTAKDLYDQFWEYKQQTIRERRGNNVQWTKVIDLLSDYMSENQILSIPKNRLDDCLEDAQTMASEHVLERV